MRRLLWLPPIGLGLLLAHGCSSTLDEYRCTAAAECIDDEGQGICHSSGYCAFVDFGECDGYRFGKHSGEQSGQCVGADDLDAGPRAPDAAPSASDANPTLTPPTATVAPISVDCEQTRINPDGRDSEAYDGATLKNFAWTLRSPSGAVISTLSGPPGSAFEPNTRFLAGVVANPSGNLTPYMDDQALKVHTAGIDADVFQVGLAIAPGAHRLSFAAASAPGFSTAGGFDYGVFGALGLPIKQGQITLTEAMTTYSLEFNTSFTISNAKVNFHASAGEFWVDNVRIQQIAPGGSDVIDPVENSSFEDNGLGPWTPDLSDANATAGSARLLSAHTQYGAYKVELVVTDSNDQTSEPKIVTVNHQACAGNGG